MGVHRGGVDRPLVRRQGHHPVLVARLRHPLDDTDSSGEVVRFGWYGPECEPMRVTAKVDYAVRAATMLATQSERDGKPLKGDQIATAQQIPVKYLENILSELRQA